MLSSQAVLAVQTRGDRQAQTWLDAWQQQQQQQQNLQCTDSSNSTPTLQQQWQTCISLVTEVFVNINRCIHVRLMYLLYVRMEWFAICI